jgi:hypothetical protein
MVETAPVSAPVTSPAPAASAPAAPAATTSAKAPSYDAGNFSAHDLFADLRAQTGLDDDAPESMDEFNSNVHEGTEEDLFGLGADGEEGTVEEGTASAVESTEETAPAVEEPKYEVDYEYEGQVGGENVSLKIKSREQMDNIISRAVHYPKLVESYKSLQKEVNTYKEAHGQLGFMEKQLTENPLKFAENIIEDLPDEQVKEWLINLAGEYGKTAEQREISKKLRAAELVQQQMEAMQRQQEQLQEQRRQAAQEADRHTVKAWADSIMTRATARIPEEYHAIVNQQLRFALKEGADMRRQGKDVSINTLNAIFQQNMQPYVKIIQGNSAGKQQQVTQEVGKAIQAKKEQGLNRMRSIASNAQPTVAGQKTNMQRAIDDSDVSGMFGEIIKGVQSGRVRVS